MDVIFDSEVIKRFQEEPALTRSRNYRGVEFGHFLHHLLGWHVRIIDQFSEGVNFA